MPAGAAAWCPAASPSKGPMVPGWAVLVVLVLSTLGACGAVPPPEPGQDSGLRWVWGAAGEVPGEPLPLSRRRRDDSGQQPGATAVPSSDDIRPSEPNLLGSVPPPAPDTNTSLPPALAVPTKADPLDESDAPELLPSSSPPLSANASLHRAQAAPTMADPLEETDSPELLLGSTPPPSANTSLHRAQAAPTTADPLEETDRPEPLLGSTPPPSANTSLHRAWAAPTMADPLEETDSPELLGSTPPPSANTSLHRAWAAPTMADPLDETDSPELLGSMTSVEPGTQAAPQNSVTTVPSLRMSLGEEGTAASSVVSSSSLGPHSVTSPALGRTATAYKKVEKSGAPAAPTTSAPWDTTAGGTAGPPPWDPSRVMGKCLLAILLLALVAATFMVCTGVLGARLWRRARTARRQLSHTEMVCISSLMPDGEVAATGPRARRQKVLLDGGSEFDGDNLTLSSFLPEHT